MRFATAVLLLCLLTFGAAQAEEVEVLPLHHRTAAQLLPLLQPLVEPGGALTGMQNTLIIRSSRRNIEELRRVLATVDTAPRRLLISVRQESALTGERQARAISGSITQGGASVGINEPPGRRTGVSVHTLDSTSASDRHHISQVQTLEGSPAYIASGESIPLPYETLSRTPYGEELRRGIELREIQSGFQVIPYVVGDEVIVEIEPQHETPGAYGPGSAEVRRMATSARGPLGEWFALGGVTNTTAQQGTRLLSSRSSGERGAHRVWLKVEIVQ